jgi:hypothetical protein
MHQTRVTSRLPAPRISDVKLKEEKKNLDNVWRP